MKKSFLLAGVFVSLLLLFSTADATVWYVHPDSTLNSIQAGLDSCNANDTVLVAAGTYVENLIWPSTQGIDLISEHGRDTTIIDANNSGRVITIETGVDSMTIINGFTIQDGNTQEEGGGIKCNNSSPTITDNVINSNHASDPWSGGGGISCTHNASPVIKNNNITNNYGHWGGGIYCDSSSPYIAYNIITCNSTSGMAGGGGIHCCHSSSPIILCNTINYNSSMAGGGICCCSASSPSIIGNTITGDTAWSAGGGIDISISAAPIITSNIITYNIAPHGGGIYCDGSPTIDSCTISNNNNSGVYCILGGNLSIHYCNIIDNIGYGVENVDSTVMVNAENNWWGHYSGPGGFGYGLGDEVSDWVDYDPWLENAIGIKERDDKQQVVEIRKRFLVYPNPFTTSTTITFIPPSIGQSAKGIGLKIYDVSGRLVKSVPLTAGTLQLGTDLSPGVYFLKAEGFDIGKVIKLR